MDPSTTIVIGAVVGLLMLALATVFVFLRLYKVAPKDKAFVRTGMSGGAKVIVDGGALIMPYLHSVTEVNLNTMKLDVSRAKEEALITKDRMRVDVLAEFYLRVKSDPDSIATAAATLGERTNTPELLKQLMLGKFIDALRSVASSMEMEELHERRPEFVQAVQQALTEDLAKNGLELESVSLTGLDQTSKEYFNADNAFDAAGLTKLTEKTESMRKRRNEIEADTRVAVEQKNLDAEKMSLEINVQTSTLRQKQLSDIARVEAEATALIAQQTAEGERLAEEARIASEREIELRNIDRLRQQEVAQQDRKISISKKSEEESAAQAAADAARATAVRAAEEVRTVQMVAEANRNKEVALVEASREAESRVIAEVASARAERESAEERARATILLAQADRDAALAGTQAHERHLEVEAAGTRAINEARNLLSEAQVALRTREIIVQGAPAILAAATKPMESIDKIQVIDIRGMGAGATGGASSTSTGSGNPENLAEQVVNGALRYRVGGAMVDSLLSSVGLSSASVSQMIPQDVASPNLGAAPDPSSATDTTQSDTSAEGADQA